MCCCGIPLHARCIVIGVLNLELLDVFYILGWSNGLDILSVIAIIAATLLIVGGLTRKRIYLWAWIVFNILLIALLVVQLGFCAYVFVNFEENYWIFGSGLYSAKKNLFRIAVIDTTVIAVHTFFVVIVFNYIFALRKEESGGDELDSVQAHAHNIVSTPI